MKPTLNKLILGVIILSAMVLGTTVGGYFALTHDLPEIRSLEAFRPPAITSVWSADNHLLMELFVEKRIPIPFEKIPTPLIQALLATEDRNFYHHSGVDLKGILRAIIKDILAGEFVEGASTITQQLAKTLFLTPRKTILRKIKEAVLALQLEGQYTKDEILALYLNQVYFGSGAYGVSAAALTFFGKSVEELTLAECALISAMLKAPSRYSPLVNIDLARQRRNIVLSQMKAIDAITKAAYETARVEKIITASRSEPLKKAPFFMDFVRDTLEETIGHSRLYSGGLTVWTTLSYELQVAAEIAVKNGLNALEDRMIKQGVASRAPECALIAIDIPSGGILAMVGGKNYQKSSYNRAVSAMRQPGSAFKPLVFANAIERGFTQSSLLLDAPVVFKGVNQGTDWEPKNFSRNFYGEMTLRKALTLSQNIPAIRLMEHLGPASVISFAHTLGINTPLAPNLSLVLGTSSVRLIDLSAAYAVFPNKGLKISPFGILEVSGHRRENLWRASPEKSIVMSPASAAVITDMLQGVILEGTGKKALVIGRPVAGKTGTTDQYKDALFVGFSPTIAVGVWVGQDKHVTLGRGETGAKAALPIWISFMEKALATRPYQEFDLPGDVVKIPMNPATGLRAAPDAKGSVMGVFKKGTEP